MEKEDTGLLRLVRLRHRRRQDVHQLLLGGGCRERDRRVDDERSSCRTRGRGPGTQGGRRRHWEKVHGQAVKEQGRGDLGGRHSGGGPAGRQRRRRHGGVQRVLDACRHLIRGIVSHPADVTVKDKELRRGRMLEVRVNPEDVGKVIGRSGRTATALRTIIGALAGSQDVRIDFIDVDKVARRGAGGRRR